MDKESLLETMRTALAPIAGMPGSILYSSHTTLTPGMFYLLGLNPGDDTGPTISECIEGTFKSKDNRNSYFDDDWSTSRRSYCVGGHPLQKHLVKLFVALGHDLRNICASNLIFTKSNGQYGAGFPRNADICWPVHRYIINIVRPSVLLVYGNGQISPYAYIRNLPTPPSTGFREDLPSISAQSGDWKCKAFKTIVDDHPVLVIGLPHLSRYSKATHPDIVKWIQNLIK